MDWLSPVREFFGFVFPFLEGLPAIRVILGFVLVFFLPGFAWSFVIFKQLQALERIVISLALSIALVTLSVLSANLLANIKISGFSSVLIIIVVTILPVIIYYLNRLVGRKKGNVT